MRISVLELFEKAADLPEEDRATLAGLLIESLESEVDESVEGAWKEEVERRVAQLDSGAVETIPWEVVRARLLQGSSGSDN
ncbi:MAG TPA: addiction module protein [Blastocatellia bacterium]|jgi:putative addiction module component (TIGR02574 family)|nr:addiction module protein [Blastocatellia bacterium]